MKDRTFVSEIISRVQEREVVSQYWWVRDPCCSNLA